MNFNRFNNNRNKFKFLFFVPIIALLSLVVMLLWNAILPGLLHVNSINYWQAAGLLILCKILFGGFSAGKMGMRGGPPAMRDKFMSMTAEEREKVKTQWQERCRKKKEQTD